MSLRGRSFYIDPATDYVSQGPSRYDLGTKQFHDDPSFNGDFNSDVISNFERLLDFCTYNDLDCYFISGPINSELVRLYPHYFRNLKNLLSSYGNNVSTDFIMFDQSFLGDTDQHVSPNFISTSSSRIFSLLGDVLK